MDLMSPINLNLIHWKKTSIGNRMAVKCQAKNSSGAVGNVHISATI